MRMSDWSSDVCSSDRDQLQVAAMQVGPVQEGGEETAVRRDSLDIDGKMIAARLERDISGEVSLDTVDSLQCEACREGAVVAALRIAGKGEACRLSKHRLAECHLVDRSEERRGGTEGGSRGSTRGGPE